MANTVSYNGVTIYNPNIQLLAAESVYDDADISVMYTKSTYRITGVVQAGSSDLGTNMVAYRVALLQPRKAMVATIGGTDVTYLTIPNGDDVGGPKPRKADITEIIGSTFSMVNWEVEIGQQECTETPSDIISHNYNVEHSLDARFYTTRTIRGTVRVRQTANINSLEGYGNNPDALRGLFAPALPDGFKRDSQSFAIAGDGLSMNYVIVDKELYRTAPSSAVEASATFTQQMSNYIWYSHFSMELKGHKNQDQLSMLNDIITVCNSRINLADPNLFIQQASIDEVLYDNIVRFQISVMSSVPATAPGQAGDGTLPAGTTIFTGIPLSDTNQNQVLGPYGTSLLQAAKMAFYDPSTPQGNLSFVQESAASDSVGTIDGSSPAESSEQSAQGSSSLAEGQLANPYTHFEETIEYAQALGTVVLPSTYAQSSGRVYQMHNPYMVLKQYGSASRVGKPVQVSDPQTTNVGFLRVRNVKPSTPILMPDKKTYQFSASWYYEILVPFTTDDFVTVGDKVNTQLGSEGVGYWLPKNQAFTFEPNDPATQMYLNSPIEVDPLT
jgi:hypothetical protein